MLEIKLVEFDEMSGEEKLSLKRNEGVESFDWAMPQDWFELAVGVSGDNPSGHVVWSYDGGSMFGQPVGIDPNGDRIVRMMDARGYGVK